MKPRLVIEADGGQHVRQMKDDSARTKYLEQQGFMVLRFWDNEVLLNPTAVMESILLAIRTLTLPSPGTGEGKDK